MPATFTIRQAAERDASRYEQIEADGYDPKYRELAPVFLGKLRAFPAGCLMVDADGESVAHLISHPWVYNDPPPLNPTEFALPAQPDVYFIHSLTIMKAFHGRGIGRALTQRAFALGRERGLTRFTLISVQNSAEFWERFGFHIVARPSSTIAASLAAYGSSAQFMEANLPI